jgi:ABC-type transporter Mla MlaB component
VSTDAVVCDVGIAGDEAAIAVVGPLTLDASADLLSAVDDVLGEPVDSLEIDLVPCDVVDLTGALTLQEAVRTCRRAGVRCCVRGANRFVRHLVEGLDLDVPLA